MIRTMNELPVAVHHESGGDARVRCGGFGISLNNVASGSFQVIGGTRFRLFVNTRTNAGLAIAIGYQNPVTTANTEMLVQDLNSAFDDVPEGTTVYWALVNPLDFVPVPGGQYDYIHVAFYG